jgi:predicted site-specific integrase-resolvase
MSKLTNQNENGASERAATKLDVASFYGVTPRCVEIWMKRGLVPYVKIGRKLVRFNMDQVQSALEQRCGHNINAKAA